MRLQSIFGFGSVRRSARRTEDWSQIRARPGAADATLCAQTAEWLSFLPEFARPKLLSMRHPRIANRLARLWLEPQDFDRYMEGLLGDERSDRTGFAPSIRAEIVRLQRFYIIARPAIERWAKEAEEAKVNWPRTA